MKKLLLLTTAIAVSILTFAQPSQGTMTAKIKGDDSSITSVEFIGNGEIRKEYDDGAWHNYFYQSYKSKSNTDYPGITYVYSGVIRYENNQFDQYLIGDSYYEGVPDPDWDEVVALLNTDIEGYVKNNHYVDIVGELSDIELTDDPDFVWHKLNSVSFNTKVTYSEKQGYTELATGERYYRVRLYSDGYKEPWKSFNSSYLKDKVDKNSFEIKEYTSEEIEAMKTLWEIDEENKAANILASLPKIEVPTFQSGKQLFYYTHDIIMTKDNNEILAYFYAVADPEKCFVKGSSSLMTKDAKEWVNKILDNIEGYRIAHCQYPSIAEEKDHKIRFYDRKNSRMLTMYGEKQEDGWKLTEIEFAAPREDEYAGLRDNDANCQGEPDLTYRERNVYKAGDKVTGVFSNGEYNGTVDMADPSRNRYQIMLVNDKPGKKYWVDEVNLKPGHVGKNIGESSSSSNNSDENNSSSSSSSSSSETFKVGDKVIVKTTQGDKKVKIIKYASHKYLVKFNDPRLGDTWCAPSNLSHQ